MGGLGGSPFAAAVRPKSPLSPADCRFGVATGVEVEPGERLSRRAGHLFFAARFEIGAASLAT